MKRALRWAGRIAGGLLAVLLLAMAGVYGVTEARFRKHYEVPATAVAVNPSTATEGRRLAVTRGCTDCHGDDLAGREVMNQFPIGRVSGSNLTRGRGGVAARYTDAQLVRAIRHGVSAEGRPLLIMPSNEFHGMSDDEVGAIIAYLRSLPPVDNQPPPNAVWPLGRTLMATGVMPGLAAEVIDHDAPRPEAPVPGITVAYGKYMAQGCTGCHGANLSGGPIPVGPPDWPEAANLTPDRATGLGGWSEDDFIRALRTGRRPDGTELKAPMPWKATSQMTEVELRAMYAYLRTIPAAPKGQR